MSAAQEALRIGSKKFTESVILGEIVRLVFESEGISAEHQRELGGTRILFSGTETGQLDVYPEYTGTIRFEILATDSPASDDASRALLAQRGLSVSTPLGFSNNYGIAVPRSLADELKLETISDLQEHPQLRIGFNHEFLERADGWPGLRDLYGLPQHRVVGIDHDLAYRALGAGDLDVMEVYTTDAEISYYDLRVLLDDRGYFNQYEAVLLYRAALEEQPAFRAALARLAGSIDEATIGELNASVKFGDETETSAAARFVATLGIEAAAESEDTRLGRIARYTLQHLTLVGLSMAAAIIVAIPVGVVASKLPGLGWLVIGGTGVIQTIPSLALLVLMLPLLGIGDAPAISALFLYSLLPIVRNTHAGLAAIPPSTEEVADALDLGFWTRLLRIELPLASRSIAAGVKTAAVLNIGFATLGAIVGSGGYGAPILTGIRLNRIDLILEGAIPAALLALAAQGLLGLAERAVVPRGLRLRRDG
ncbi:MAG: glycine betaine ABC transporter substrate-binding protein [Planctomycetota bacterium]